MGFFSRRPERFRDGTAALRSASQLIAAQWLRSAKCPACPPNQSLGPKLREGNSHCPWNFAAQITVSQQETPKRWWEHLLKKPLDKDLYKIFMPGSLAESRKIGIDIEKPCGGSFTICKREQEHQQHRTRAFHTSTSPQESPTTALTQAPLDVFEVFIEGPLRLP